MLKSGEGMERGGVASYLLKGCERFVEGVREKAL